MGSGLLRLRAGDAEDLKVMSAVLQDAIVPICDMIFLPEERRFVLVATRFRWERPEGETVDATFEGEGDAAPFERINTALRFEGVDRVCCKELNLKDRTQMLNLLAVERSDDKVLLHFSGGPCVRLDVPVLDCRLEDLGEPWPTGLRPCHDQADGQASAAASGR